MPSKSQRHRTRTLPFRYQEEGLAFDIQRFATDGSDPEPLSLNATQREIDLTARGQGTDDWMTATLEASLTLPPDVIEAVLPSDERDAPPAKLYVACRCHETIYRDRIDVASAPVEPGEYSVTITLNREQFKGKIEFRPYLVRTRNRDDVTTYASTKNVRLADDLPYRFIVDHPEDDEPPSIDGEAVSFSQTAHLPDGDRLYHLDFRNEARPKLWLNADYPRVTNVLESRGSIGAEPRMRDVVLDQISYGIWTQLVVRAVTAIDQDGNVRHDWQETVLKTFARGLTERSNLEAAKLDLRSRVRDPESLGEFVSDVDAEIQEYVDPRTQLINLMEEGLKL